MKFTNTYRYVVLKQVMFLILFLIILVCMIKIDLEYPESVKFNSP